MLPSFAIPQRQSLPLDAKIVLSKQRIREWIQHWHGQACVCVSGIDSLVLWHLVKQVRKNVVAVFSNTGLEFPEISDFFLRTDGIDVIRPEKTFRAVVTEYGYPVVSKRVARYVRDLRRPEEANPNTKRLRLTGINRAGKLCPSMKLSNKWRFLINAPFKISEQCCEWLKKKPLRKFQKQSGLHPMLGILLEESMDRKKTYLQHGCNGFSLSDPVSWPIAFWTKADVWEYAIREKLQYPAIYDMGYKRCGCVFCGFGAHLEKEPNRFQLLYKTHPKLWAYCMDKLGMREVLEFVGVPIQ